MNERTKLTMVKMQRGEESETERKNSGNEERRRK